MKDSAARFVSPLQVGRPRGARLLEAHSPKLGRRVRLFDHLAFAQWIHGINRGVMLPPGLDEQWLVSVMHSEDDAQLYARVFQEFVDELVA